MASAAPAYRSQPRRASRRRPQVSVVRSSRREPTLSRRAVLVARIIVGLVVLFALVGCVRIGLTAATVNTAIATEAMAAEMSDLQSVGANLEVKESSLTNPSYMRNVATKELGMSAPASIDTIALGSDIVSLDAEGNLSLSLSLAQVAKG